ncbi:hypothetical protein SAMN02745121_09186 [Nannocystis exedens]|uniref:Uncharacterized protein n=1 Tax=Nannocystis exedens TaxID=54 RepID=A0A1I2J6G5_9BACT|nr:hypothetical protein NAEX_00001 [Nannocystis exedens]PCC67252.1 hypothetical protein NAEX_00255 [Nannocystis exedens]SFF49610.1 hypothetical protein SAMN02745121_09186 [Nannocystis exedens]
MVRAPLRAQDQALVTPFDPRLENDIEAYIAASNDEPRLFAWTESAEEILASIGRYCLRTLDATA